MRKFLGGVMVVCAVVNLIMFAGIVLTGWNVQGPDYVWAYLDMRINRFPYLLYELVTALGVLWWLIAGENQLENRSYGNANWSKSSLSSGAFASEATAASFSIFDSDLASDETIFAGTDSPSFGGVSELDASYSHPEFSSINPANGLPMCGSVDIEGNAYGTDFSTDCFNSDLMNIDDSMISFDDCSSGFDDFSSGIDDDWL